MIMSQCDSLLLLSLLHTIQRHCNCHNKSVMNVSPFFEGVYTKRQTNKQTNKIMNVPSKIIVSQYNLLLLLSLLHTIQRHCNCHNKSVVNVSTFFEGVHANKTTIKKSKIKQSNNQTILQSNKQTNKQTNKHTNKQTNIPSKMIMSQCHLLLLLSLLHTIQRHCNCHNKSVVNVSTKQEQWVALVI